MSELRRGTFREEDLMLVDTSNCVVLNSGGPLMDIEAEEGDNLVCSWWTPEGNQRTLLPKACVSQLVQYTDAPRF